MHAERAREVFEQALGIPLEQREHFVRAACQGHEELRREVLGLLRADAEATESLAPGLCEAIRQQTVWPTVAGYAIERCLGGGSASLVFAAWQNSPPRRVALKFLRSARPNAPMMHRLLMEAEALARLTHPSIPRLHACETYDAGSGPHPVLVMEFVDGSSATEFANRHSLSISQRLDLVCQLCAAIEHAHQRGVIHRDLKPENVLVEAAENGPRVRVLDFSIARVADALTRPAPPTLSGEVVGTLGYMSPEQARGEQVDTRTDVYAIGVLLFELLTGRLPIEVAGAPTLDVLQRIAHTPPARLAEHAPHLPPALEDVVQRALAKDPEQRYASVAALHADLRAVLAGEPIAAHRYELRQILKTWMRRHKTAASFAAVAALALAITVGSLVYALQVTRKNRTRCWTFWCQCLPDGRRDSRTPARIRSTSTRS
jgi:serine/threonine protein kinase